MVCSAADSYVKGADNEAGATADVVSSRKVVKYAELDGRVFQPIAVETLGVLSPSSRIFLSDVSTVVGSLIRGKPKS